MKKGIVLLLFFLCLSISQAQDVRVTVVPFTPSECSGIFVAHDLDHETTVPGGEEIRMFEANGGGVAINDLNDDGRLDVVLANHAGMNTILWNEGGLSFRPAQLSHGDSRAVNIVDINADGLLDILFTRTASAPNYWRNLGNGEFELNILPNISKPLYTTSWADLDGDGDLDLVGGTYDAGLLVDFGQDFLASGDAGVYYYENIGERMQLNFSMTRLAAQAQALALVLVDLNDDDRLDIMVGNDFAVPDFVWYRTDDGWNQADAFNATSHSTMSFDFADFNNDGQPDILSTDMKPYDESDETMSAWQPVMENMVDEPHAEDDPQVMANVLQIGQIEGFVDQAEIWGLDATGWSWSGKFGDLNHDGLLDVYVVNGMMESTTFAHLPNHELVEENQAFRNSGTDFKPMPEWGLNSTRSGRGMSMADLDNDGDLDIVVNNLRGVSQLFENQLCSGASIQVDLLWYDSQNTRAIGAELVLTTNAATYTRHVKTLSGYLSGDPSRIHFGFPEDEILQSLEIRWPDGNITTLTQLTANALHTVNR